MGFGVGVIGLSVSEFYELTPIQFNAIVSAYNKHKVEHYKSLEMAIYSGNGQLYSKKAFKSAFDEPPKPKSREQVKQEQEEVLKRLGFN